MRWKFVVWLTVVATNLSGILIRKRQQPYTFEMYGAMPLGSLGHTYYKTLTDQKMTYKPNLIRHDLKHVLLGYTMQMPDELRIHAFLIGNRSYNPMAILYLLVCFCVVPEIVPSLKKDFQRGRKSPSLKNTPLFDLVNQDLKICRQKLKIQPLV